MRVSIYPNSREGQTCCCTEQAIGCIFRRPQAVWDTMLSMETNRTSHNPSQWLLIAAIWFGIGLFDATQTVFSMRAAGMHHAWVYLFITLLLSWLPWALATPMVLKVGRNYPLVQLRPFSAWPRHFAACAMIGLVQSAWTACLEKLLNPWAHPSGLPPFMELWRGKFYSGLLSYVILYAFILVVSNMLASRERLASQQTETARLNELLSKAQLNALRRQIEPHFLFNTLNSIAGLVRERRNDAAVNMIAGLSDFLRRVLEDSNRQQVPLAEEMQFLQKYLDIQKLRFAERLRLNVDVATELFPAQVPSLILQPMVENAVKHGIAKRAQGGEIRITASRSNGMLTLSVYNDGPSLPDNWEMTQSGIGMSNIRTRLQSLYGDACGLSMKNHGADGVEVSVRVPFVSAPIGTVPT